MEAYKKAFAPLTVPDDMMDRIMAQAEKPCPKRRKLHPALALAACLALLVCGTVALRAVQQPGKEEFVQGVNPIQASEDTAQLAESLPFPLSVPTQLPEGYATEHASSIMGTLAQVIYTDGTDRITYRMAQGSDDISGDYHQWPEAVQETCKAGTVTLKGDGGSIYLALWTDEAYSYSLAFSAGVSAETARAVVDHIEPVT